MSLLYSGFESDHNSRPANTNCSLEVFDSLEFCQLSQFKRETSIHLVAVFLFITLSCSFFGLNKTREDRAHSIFPEIDPHSKLYIRELKKRRRRGQHQF